MINLESDLMQVCPPLVNRVLVGRETDHRNNSHASYVAFAMARDLEAAA